MATWMWPGLTKSDGFKVMFDIRHVERVEQLKRGSRVFFTSGSSVTLAERYEYVSELIVGHSGADGEEMETNAQGT